MMDLEQEENCADCYTGVVAYWAKENEPVMYTPVYAASNAYGYVKILPLDLSDKWDDMPTQAELNNAAKNYIVANQIGVPKVSWTVEFIPLEDTEEYKNIASLEQVNIGDTVAVKFEKFGIDVSARVTSIDWEVLKSRYQSVHLGAAKQNAADTIAKQNAEIAQLLNINKRK
jgi:phage-related protein